MPRAFQLTRDDGKGVLQLGGPGEDDIKRARLCHALYREEAGNYMVECSIRKVSGSWAGLVFRRGKAGMLEVFLDQENRILLRRHPGSKVLKVVPTPKSENPWRRLRVVGVGPDIRVYVDGKKLAEVKDEKLLSGACGLMGHYVHALFDDFVMTTEIPGD